MEQEVRERAKVLSLTTWICPSSGNQEDDTGHSSNHCGRPAQVRQASPPFPPLPMGEAVLTAPGRTSASPPTTRAACSAAQQLLGVQEKVSAFLCSRQGGEPTSLLSCTQDQPPQRVPGLHACQRQTLLNLANSTLTESLLL